jgi:hypothetical protein
VAEEVVRSTVQVVRGNDFIPRLGDVQDGQGDRRLAARDPEGGGATVELREPLLEHVGRRVHEAGVDVPELLERE